MDDIDLKILQALARDGRMSWQGLADEVGLSLTPTLRRVRRLEAENYILGYAAKLNYQQLGRPLHAILFIDLERQSKEACEQFEDNICRIAAVRSCNRVTGKPDYMANTMARDVAEYQTLMTDVSAIPGVARLRSNLMLKIVRAISPPRAPGR